MQRGGAPFGAGAIVARGLGYQIGVAEREVSNVDAATGIIAREL